MAKPKKINLQGPLGTYWEIESYVEVVEGCHEYSTRVYGPHQIAWLDNSFNLRIFPDHVEVNQYGRPGSSYDSTWCDHVFGSNTQGGLRAKQEKTVEQDGNPIVRIKRLK